MLNAIFEFLNRKCMEWFGVALWGIWGVNSGGEPPFIFDLEEKCQAVFRTVSGSNADTFAGYWTVGPGYHTWLRKISDNYVGVGDTREIFLDFDDFETNTGVSTVADLEARYGTHGDWVTLRPKLTEAINRRVRGGAPTIFIKVRGAYQINPFLISNATAKFLTRVQGGDANHVVQELVQQALNYVFSEMMLEEALILTREEKKRIVGMVINLVNTGCKEVEKDKMENGEDNPRAGWPIEDTHVAGMRGLYYYGLVLSQFGIQKLSAPDKIMRAIEQEESAGREAEAFMRTIEAAKNIETFSEAMTFAAMTWAGVTLAAPGIKAAAKKKIGG